MVVSVVARNETTRLLAKMGVCRLDVVRTERASRSAADSASPDVCVHRLNSRQASIPLSLPRGRIFHASVLHAHREVGVFH